jgi:hypothetical protein
MLGGCEAQPDEPPEALDEVEQPLSTISCGESKATGYVKGKAFAITVVKVDGKPVQIDTANAYYVMAVAASKAGVNLKVVSGFRTMAEQQYLYNCYLTKKCNNGNLAAKPGYSNHQSGHALDLNTSSSGVYTWLTNHGGKYGFKRTVPSEKWHWEWWGGGPGGGPCGQDKDGDKIPDSKDNCPTVSNKSQADHEKDGKGDACDTDDDNDGVADTKDNCPKNKNADQKDVDKDGKGDACDADDDGDGFPDAEDVCPKVVDEQLDTDGDKIGDACDDDDDNDSVLDADDDCPEAANPEQKDTDGDGQGDACDDDDDDDGLEEPDDNCPFVPNPDQADLDEDGVGDACDDDKDDDGVHDLEDLCPAEPDPDQGDTDGDGLGDSCDHDVPAESEDPDLDPQGGAGGVGGEAGSAQAAGQGGQKLNTSTLVSADEAESEGGCAVTSSRASSGAKVLPGLLLALGLLLRRLRG